MCGSNASTTMSPTPGTTTIDGFGGNKTAYFDTVTFRIIPEAGAAVAALEAGEVHLLEQIPVPTARRLASNDDITIYENMPWAFLTFIYNLRQAPTDNQAFREAIQVAINKEEVMAIATEGLYNLHHGWMYDGSTYDAGDIGGCSTTCQTSTGPRRCWPKRATTANPRPADRFHHPRARQGRRRDRRAA
jgi:ABC-type transport system substrate-binding protein